MSQVSGVFVVRVKQIKPILSVLLFHISCVAAFAKHATIDLTRFVAVGDSLSAGVSNIGLVEGQQEAGYLAVLARQAGITLDLPLIAKPGMPPVLRLQEPVGLIPQLTVDDPANLFNNLLNPQRTNPKLQPTNVSVPGFTVAQALQFRPTTLAVQPGPEQWGNLVLGYPSPFLPGSDGVSRTMIEQALLHNPTAALVWLGNNDALVPALVGGGLKNGNRVGIADAITPPANFERDYKAILDKLCGFVATSSTGNNGVCTSEISLITATIPDLTAIPYFTPLDEVAQLFGVSTKTLMSKTGLNKGDSVRRSALPEIQKILNGDPKASIAGMCDSPIYALPVKQVPCVFKAADAVIVQNAVSAYNDAIARRSAAHDAFVLDTNGFISRLQDKGYKIRSLRLTTSYLGGLFSLDGIHPSVTGYAVLANSVIDALNKEYKLKIPEASVEDVWNSDPLKPYSVAQ